jgi:hypothetical protein
MMMIMTLMMEAARTAETLVKFYQTTWCSIKKKAIFLLTAERTSNPKRKIYLCSNTGMVP